MNHNRIVLPFADEVYTGLPLLRTLRLRNINALASMDLFLGEWYEKLTDLDLSGNTFEGQISEKLSLSTALGRLEMNGVSFAGEASITQSLAQMTRLSFLIYPCTQFSPTNFYF